MAMIPNQLAEKIVDDLDTYDTEVALQAISLVLVHFQTVLFEDYWREYILSIFNEANEYRKDHTTLRSFSPQEIHDYVEEAEHQDGTGYWTKFITAKELLDDMEVYHANKQRTT